MKLDTASFLTLITILIVLVGNLIALLQGIARLEEGLKFAGKRADGIDTRLNDHEGRIGHLEVGHGELRTAMRMEGQGR